MLRGGSGGLGDGSGGLGGGSGGPGGGSGGPGRFETLISYEGFSSKGSGGVPSEPRDTADRPIVRPQPTAC